MALSLLRNRAACLAGSTYSQLNVTKQIGLSYVQVATLVSKTMRDPDYKRPAPFPYKTKTYNYMRYLFDKTTHRFDENTKVLIVDGPVAAGKAKFAQELADELDMLYVPPANLDTYFLDDYGYDVRRLESQFPETMRTITVEESLQDPDSKHLAKMQFVLMMEKYRIYMEALSHLFSTGQGVVLNSSFYGDFVYVEALHRLGYLSNGARKVYYRVRDQISTYLLKPHVVIYLDVSPEKVLENITARNLPHEKNAKLYTVEFFEALEAAYKTKYLKEMRIHSELLMYDWNVEGDPDAVVEDLMRLQFEYTQSFDQKMMEDWQFQSEYEYCQYREKYTRYHNVPFDQITWFDFSAPELMFPADDLKEYNKIIAEQAPGRKYMKGYNADMGDTNILWKVRND